MQSEKKYQRLLKNKLNPPTKEKKIDAIEMDYSELDRKFNEVLIIINEKPLSKLAIARHLNIGSSDITHKNNGIRSKYSIEQKQKVLDLCAAVALRLTNII